LVPAVATIPRSRSMKGATPDSTFTHQSHGRIDSDE
jgi:hypothetical protein